MIACFGLYVCLGGCDKGGKARRSYQAIHQRDTALLDLVITDRHFYGKYRLMHPGGASDVGDVTGKVIGDTLLGDFFYLSYGAKHKKRKAFALLRRDAYLIQGTGLQTVFMGVPSYLRESLDFDSVKFVFEPMD